jgi:hypothetical protein
MKVFGVRIVAALTVVAGLSAVVVPHVSAASAPPDPGVGDHCDVLQPQVGASLPIAGHTCLLPWPNDAFTKKATTSTGRQINLYRDQTPKNKSGKSIDPTYQNYNDGFSPGSEIMVAIPNLSLANSNIATSQQIDTSSPPKNACITDATLPVRLFDVTKNVCVPYWAEIDAQDPNATDSLLLIHPATNFVEGDRIVVVLGNLKDTNNSPIPEAPGMQAALAGSTTRDKYLQYVKTTELKTFTLTNLYEAWDFTVISGGGTLNKLAASNLADPALTMRQQAFAALGARTPAFKVTSAFTNTNGDWQVDGIFQVPTFLQNCPTTLTYAFTSNAADLATNTGNCGAMNLDKNHLPLLEKTAYSTSAKSWSNQLWADFICVMPGTPQATPAIATLYGHGLLGSANEVISSEHKGVLDNISGCATDWTGMSQNDLLIVAGSLNDMSNFHKNVDHMLQGFVNFQMLGKLLISPQGFATDPAFVSQGKPRIAFGSVQYQGYSQGGIMGGALSAISNEWNRVVLGVPGQNYGGILLDRSVDWTEFASIYDPAYPNPLDQELGLQITQMLWDRGENNGYSEHLTSKPYGGTNAKAVYAIVNYGDHQVSNLGAESLLRTIGATTNQPAFSNSSWPTARVNLPHAFTTTPATQALLGALDYSKKVTAAGILWDYGTPTPPTVNLPPAGSAYGQDPHGFGRETPGLVDQIKNFFQTGYLSDICHGACVGVPSP